MWFPTGTSYGCKIGWREFDSAPEKRPCTPKDTILTPGFGYSITPVPKFPDRPGRENRVHFSYARDKTTDQAAPDCPRGTQCLNVRIAAAIGGPGPAKRAVATGCSTPSVLNARQRTVSHFTASTKPITGRLKRPVEADAESLQELL